MTIAQGTALAEANIHAALVRSLALRQDYQGADDAARQLGAPPEMVEKIKAVTAWTVEGTPGLAGNSAASIAFLQRVGESSLLARLLADNAESWVPLQTRPLGLAADATAYVVGEGAAIPLSPMSLDGRTVDPFKIAAHVVTSRELWEKVGSEGQAFLNNLLQQAVARTADASFFGRFIARDAPTFSALGTTPEAIALGLRQALDAVHVRPGARLYWAVSTGAANVLASQLALPHLNPFTGSVGGIPAIITSGLAGRRMALVDARGFVGDLDATQIESATHTTLEMSEDPDGSSTAPLGTQIVSLWQSNSRAARLVLNLGFDSLRDNALAVLDLTEGA